MSFLELDNYIDMLFPPFYIKSSILIVVYNYWSLHSFSLRKTSFIFFSTKCYLYLRRSKLNLFYRYKWLFFSVSEDSNLVKISRSKPKLQTFLHKNLPTFPTLYTKPQNKYSNCSVFRPHSNLVNNPAYSKNMGFRLWFKY